MAAVLFFCLPLLFVTHVAFSKNKAEHVLAYCIGVAAGIALLFVFSWFDIVFDNATASLLRYWLNYAIVYILVPSFFCMFLYFLLSFPFSTKVLLFFPSLVFGLFTLHLYMFILTYSSSIRILPIVFHIIIYASAIFAFDAVTKLVAAMAEFHIIVFLSSVCIFCCIIFIGVYAYTLWYFNTRVFFSYFIFTLMPLTTLGMQFFCMKKGLMYNVCK